MKGSVCPMTGLQRGRLRQPIYSLTVALWPFTLCRSLVLHLAKCVYSDHTLGLNFTRTLYTQYPSFINGSLYLGIAQNTIFFFHHFISFILVLNSSILPTYQFFLKTCWRIHHIRGMTACFKNVALKIRSRTN